MVRPPHSPHRPPQLSLRGGVGHSHRPVGGGVSSRGGLATPKWPLVLLSMSLSLSLYFNQHLPPPLSTGFPFSFSDPCLFCTLLYLSKSFFLFNQTYPSLLSILCVSSKAMKKLVSLGFLHLSHLGIE